MGKYACVTGQELAVANLLGGGFGAMAADMEVVTRVLRYVADLDECDESQVLVEQRLGDGVSCESLLLQTPRRRLVAKIPLSEMRTADPGPADPERVLNEVAGLKFAGQVRPGSSPRVLQFRRSPAYVLLEYIGGGGWSDLRTLLLEGVALPEWVFRNLGDWLSAFHSTPWKSGSRLLAHAVHQRRSFYEMRVFPFYARVADMLPDLREVIQRTTGALLEERSTAVHGDFSPKNILVAPSVTGRLCIVDFEIFHLGSPVFDVASMLHHLVLKAYLPRTQPAAVIAYVRTFVASYTEGSALGRHDWRALRENLGVLLLGRLYGRARVPYLGELAAQGTGQVESLARTLLGKAGDNPRTLDPIALSIVSCLGTPE